MALCLATDAAEAQGDVARALRIMESRPLDPYGKPFWRPGRLRRLRQLLELRPLLPAWVTSRWLLELALQAIDPGVREASRRALTTAIDVRGGRPLPGVDEIDARCRVMERDWVYREAFLFGQGGLRNFLRHASPELLAEADRVDEWAVAPMRSLRLVSRSSRTVAWEDVGTGESVSMLNTGCAALVLPGECVLGRVVPIENGCMFETAPLVVPDSVAAWVADEPEVWVDVLAAHNRNAAVEPVRTSGLHEYGLLSDVPRLAWRLAASDVIEPGSAVRTRFPRRADVDPQAQALVAFALDPRTHAVLDAIPPDQVHPWSCVAAALVEPGFARHLAAQLEPDDAEGMRRLADRLAEPASDVCRHLARGLSSAA